MGEEKKLSKSKMQNIRKPFISEENKKNKDRIIRDIWTRRRKRRKKEIREIKKKKEHNERLIKGRIIRDIRTFFEQEEDHYKPKRVKE